MGDRCRPCPHRARRSKEQQWRMTGVATQEVLGRSEGRGGFRLVREEFRGKLTVMGRLEFLSSRQQVRVTRDWRREEITLWILRDVDGWGIEGNVGEESEASEGSRRQK